MNESGPGDSRVVAARSRHRRFWSFVAPGAGIRVIEFHILGTQAQLLSINMGRRWPPLSSWRSPANTEHRRVDMTITVERRRGFVNHCGRGVLIEQSRRLLLLWEVAFLMIARCKYIAASFIST
jgi:hypothetical protein